MTYINWARVAVLVSLGLFVLCCTGCGGGDPEDFVCDTDSHCEGIPDEPTRESAK